MTQVTINLYSFSELSKEAQQKAMESHAEFLITTDENANDYTENDVIENIEANEYVFFQDGRLAHCTTYTGKHPKSGTTEFHFHGTTYDITKQPA